MLDSILDETERHRLGDASISRWQGCNQINLIETSIFLGFLIFNPIIPLIIQDASGWSGILFTTSRTPHELASYS